MSDPALSHVTCSVCQSDIPVPPEHHWRGQSLTILECETCHVRHDLRVTRVDRPAKWTAVCSECDHQGTVTWEEMRESHYGEHDYCEECNAPARLLIHYE